VGRCGFAQTPGSCGAGSTIFLTSEVDIVGAIAVRLVAGMAGELLPLGANVNLVDRIKGEISGSEGGRFAGLWLFGLDAVLEALLVSKALVPFSELDIGDISIDVFGLAQGERLERVVVAVGSELFFLEEGITFSDGDGVFFAPLIMGSRFS